MCEHIKALRSVSIPIGHQRHETVVLFEVARAGFASWRQLETGSTVAIRLVPQVVQHANHDGVVRGAVKGLVDLAVRRQCYLTPLPRHREQVLEGGVHAGDVRIGTA